MSFLISWIGLLSGLCLVNGLGLFQKTNPGAHHPDESRPIGLRALWLVDPKSWVLTISELICFLCALENEMFCEYQVLGERSTSPDIVVDPSAHLMHLFMPYPI